MRRVLFVCLGNICRSPAAEEVFRQLVTASSLEIEIDSAGTSDFHVGEEPDPRMVSIARRRGYRLRHAARQVEINDFPAFDHLIAMDRNNQAELLRKAPPGTAHKVLLFRSLDDPGSEQDVPDPYYGGESGFDEVITILERVGRRWLERLSK
jgi:protein-tyrosine phosphatase